MARHPDTQEFLIRAAGMSAEIKQRIKTKKNPDITRFSHLRHFAFDHTRIRRMQEYNDIIEKILHGGGSAYKNRNPEAVIVVGPPGSGKTTLAVPHVKKVRKSTFASINPDDIKEAFNDYDGWNAAGLHAESAYVSEKMLKETVVNSQFNFIYDITGRHSEKVESAIEEFAENGYRVHLVLVELPPWMAVWRVWERFQRNPFGRILPPPARAARFVDPHFVYEDVGTKPFETYNSLKKHKKLSGFCCIDAVKSTPKKIVISETGKGW
jgi:adenylate kinase family enzyme